MKIFKFRILNHVLFWIFIYAFYTVPFIVSYGFETEAFINLIYLPFDIMTVYLVIEFLIPRFLLKKRNFIVFILGTVIFIGLNFLISQFIKYTVQPALGFWIARRTLTVDLFYSLLTNFMIVGMASALKLFSYSYNIQLIQSELERRSIRSELGVLRSQINPHFLFNVLNNIDSLIYEDKDKASNAIFLLSKIMRYMLKESNEEKAMLINEVEYIQDFIELARLSFEDPKFLEFTCSGDLGKKQIPPLLFIPLIENTIKHCNKQSKSPGIQIEFKVENDFVELKTSNFVKRNDFKLPDAGSGNGLKNVEKRLKLLFEKNYVFDINSNMDKFDVYLKIPLL
ncbi:MAG TPA: histidine kinase [Draconibacterium sp.]|nr:histidine kinase [Draconibacterium sp.]